MSEPTGSPSKKPVRKKEEVTVDDLYRRLTQFEMWSYTPEALLETKKKTNENGRALASKNFTTIHEELRKAEPEVFEKFNKELSSESLVDLLSFEEESKFLNFYSKNIIKTCEHFKMPTQVKATAVSFFKRFYLVNSVMQYHPKNILYTCVFLASKSENYFISIESFVRALSNTLSKDILDLEFIVLQSIKFTLMVHHPFRPLYGFFLDCQAVLLHPSPLMYDVTVDTLGSLYDKSKNWLNEYALLSDVSFLFTPPQIALAAMYDIDKRITDRYLKRKFLTENTSKPKSEDDSIKPEINGDAPKEDPEVKDNLRAQYELIVLTIRKCIRVAKQIPESSREESKEIDKKLYFALNPRRLIEKNKKKLLTPNPINN